MIFRPDHARMILQGRKTQTRRRVRPGETECRYRQGQSYAVQHDRQKPSIGRLVIVSAAPQQLGDLTLRDAKAEGFRTRRDFLDFWRGLFPTMSLEDPVWALLIQPDRDPVRMLHRDSTRGYTTRRRVALPDEPEAVDHETQVRYSAEGFDRHRAFRDGEPLDDRLSAALARARTAGVDVTREVAGVRRRVEAIERKAFRPTGPR